MRKLPLFVMDNWYTAIEPHLLFEKSLQVKLPSWFIKPESEKHRTTWLTYHKENGVSERLNGIHCFDYGQFGLAGSCAFNCSKTLSFNSLVRFKDHFMSTLRPQLEDYGNDFRLRNMILREDRRITDGTGKSSLNITIVQRLHTRSIFNINEIYDKILEMLNQIANLSFTLRLVHMDQKPEIYEQVHLFQITTIFICAHGNVMGNFIFLPFERRKVALIEIKPPQYPHTFFEEVLDQWFGDKRVLLYEKFYCRNQSYCSIPAEYQRVESSKNWDFRVDWLDLKPLVERSVNFTSER